MGTSTEIVNLDGSLNFNSFVPLSSGGDFTHQFRVAGGKSGKIKIKAGSMAIRTLAAACGYICADPGTCRDGNHCGGRWKCAREQPLEGDKYPV